MSLKINPFIKWITAIFIVIICGLSVLAFFTTKSTTAHTNKPITFINDNATQDTPVETLKTLTAEISSVEQQNQQLITQNKALQEKDKTTLVQFKQDVLNSVQQQLASAKNTLSPAEKSSNNHLLDSVSTPQIANMLQNAGINNNSTTLDTNSNLVWINDLQQTPTNKINSENDLTTLFNKNNVKKQIVENKIVSTPYYTIPINATLTGVIAMQPIIGRIPIDGKVPDPYTFKVIIGAKNLAANGIDVPDDIQGIVASGVAEGDMLGHCARGDITSMTFVFQDGRISTTQAQNGVNLGTIAAANGNPCISGSFHSDAALFLVAEAGLAGLQGYGNALSQSQLSNTTSPMNGASISSLIGNANKYAFGQGFAESSKAAQHWWEQRVQNSFDFVFVPNVDPKTKKKLQLNINITQEIPIDYDPSGRKVFYGHL